MINYRHDHGVSQPVQTNTPVFRDCSRVPTRLRGGTLSAQTVDYTGTGERM